MEVSGAREGLFDARADALLISFCKHGSVLTDFCRDCPGEDDFIKLSPL